ncbi:M14 family zinc carboxypeptidase [Aquimarina agarivorans]|uniref:M14 family zinc carboxypeptidase n=1 Tax=Aquimarina agarivorans TaxID=980584 RepID=UPI000248F88B|nr:M14 family zinc carboxypeptidase [Aquimarina agarivorans]
MTTAEIIESFHSYKEETLKGRYITQKDIQPLITQWATKLDVEQLGVSENKLPIHLIKIGTGTKKLLFWSQMHGNESTTTKALFDLFHFLDDSANKLSEKILKECTLYIIPMLNPDGALAYTRVNYNGIDLNRDAQNLEESESKIFKAVVYNVKPLVAFNLHGQRTIFSAGNTTNSAIVSFLSPASNNERTITESRKKGMRIIAEMNKALQTAIPNCVGRYDDGFNINCTGDTMEYNGYTTILFEAGHHPNDYEREVTRKWMYLSLITALKFIAETGLSIENYEAYFDIPENGKLFKDIIIRNYPINGEKFDVALQYQETLVDKNLRFIPIVAQIETQIIENGHIEFNCDLDKVEISNVIEKQEIETKIDYLSINDEKFSVFPIKK